MTASTASHRDAPAPAVQEVLLRRATLLDSESIAAFQTACWQEACRGLLPAAFLDEMDLDARTATWRRRIEQQERLVVVGTSHDGVAGAVSWTPGAVDELDTLSVAEAARGTGLAVRLLEAAIADRPAMLRVFSGDVRARRFSQHQGFEPTGVRRIDEGTGVEEMRFARTARSDPSAPA